MTYLLKDIRDHLQGYSDINDAFDDRIFPDVVPQNTTYPYIVLGEVSITPEEGLVGEVGTHRTIVQIDVWTDGTGGGAAAKRMGELIRNRLSGYKGQLGEGVWCNGSHLTTSRVLIGEPASPGSDVYRRQVFQQYDIIHSADVPTFA